MELTGAAVAARKDWTMTRRGSVRVERLVRLLTILGKPFLRGSVCEVYFEFHAVRADLE